MGRKAKRKQEFLKQHPYCCFCGGTAKSEEPDHIPSRALFDDRQWPEGYEFPACVPCNRASRNIENVIALLSRLYPDVKDEKAKTKVVDLFRSIDRNYPGLLEEMMTSPIQVRQAVRKYGLSIPKGKTTLDMPLLNAKGSLLNHAIHQFGRKLFLALYYFHAQKPLPKNGGILIRWYSNLQVENDEIPKELADMVSQLPSLERSNMDLSDQFFYRYGISSGHEIAIFLAFFRRSFALLGFVETDIKRFEDFEDTEVFGPFHH